MTNRTLADAFANTFDPPLKVMATQRINGVPVTEGYCVAWHKDGVGINFLVFGDGVFQATLEIGAGSPMDAAQALRAGLDRLQEIVHG